MDRFGLQLRCDRSDRRATTRLVVCAKNGTGLCWEVKMRWKGREGSSNVEDRRGQGGGLGGGLGGGFPGGRIRLPGGLGGGGGMRRAGGPGIGMIVIIFIVLWFLGINPMDMLGGGQTSSFQEDRPAGTQTVADDEMSQFVSVVLKETETTWTDVFQASGETYPKPTLVLFTEQTASACGYASAASGPFYCPGDQKLYIDLAFYEELRRRFQAPGDFAQAYVIAHEVGHHVQNLIGVLPEFNRRRQSMSEREANAMSIRVELQADCFAGIWAADAERKGLLEPGDMDEALNAATQIGDDAIQKRTQGYVVPESFNHGTSEQRQRWFRTGYDSGSVDACDTFEARTL
jgi:predicted metalloprotease